MNRPSQEEDLTEQVVTLLSHAKDIEQFAELWAMVPPGLRRQVLVSIRDRGGLTAWRLALTFGYETARLVGRVQVGIGAREFAGGRGTRSEALVRSLVASAVERLPASERARYREEWNSDFANTHGRRARLRLALGIRLRARRLRAACGERDRQTTS